MTSKLLMCRTRTRDCCLVAGPRGLWSIQVRSLPCERDDPGTEAACEEQRAVLKEDAHRWETKRRSQGEQEKAREAGKSEERDLTEPRGEGLRRGTLHRSESCRKVRRTRGRSLPVGGSRVAVWERARAGEWTGRSTDQEERRRGWRGRGGGRRFLFQELRGKRI